MLGDCKKDAKEKMSKVIDVFNSDVRGIRVGRANSSMLDGLSIEAYGGRMKINQVAGVTVVDNRTLNIRVWDKNLVSAVKSAILDSDLGVNPVAEGEVILIVFPEMTKDMRQKMVKMLNKVAENAKVALRNVRRQLIDGFKEQEEQKLISEDDMHLCVNAIQEVTEEMTDIISKTVDAKEKDLLKV